MHTVVAFCYRTGQRNKGKCKKKHMDNNVSDLLLICSCDNLLIYHPFFRNTPGLTSSANNSFSIGLRNLG